MNIETMTPREIAEAINSCAIHSETDREGDRVVSQSFPTVIVRSIIAELRDMGADVDWAKDNDDPSQAWIYI